MMKPPRKPDFKGKLQLRIEQPDKVIYADKGEIALWKSPSDRFVLRGYVTIDGQRYHVSLEENGTTEVVHP